MEKDLNAAVYSKVKKHPLKQMRTLTLYVACGHTVFFLCFIHTVKDLLSNATKGSALAILCSIKWRYMAVSSKTAKTSAAFYKQNAFALTRSGYCCCRTCNTAADNGNVGLIGYLYFFFKINLTHYAFLSNSLV